MVIGKIVSWVLLTWFPYEIACLLPYSVINPTVVHVKCFREFVSHVVSEYAVGKDVVGF